MHMDVQNQKPTGNFKLTRVGVTGIKKPINVQRPDKVVTLTAQIDVFVDLPSGQKGSHLSRNVEVISEILDKSVREPVSSLELLCEEICHKLLERHEYATYSEVGMQANYFLEKALSSGRKSLEEYKLIAKASAKRNEETSIKKCIGVEVVGMTTCPCAMETVRNMLEAKHPEAKECLKKIPVVTHNQRNITTLTIEVPRDYDVEADDLIQIVEDSLSSPTYEILKRDDEALVTLQAHENPKFVEDVVRDILGRILENYPDFPDSVVVTVRSESEESIHKHNAFAERVTTMGELRK
ncbi:MAG: GTP cyclohydrolase I FolE2 [Methanomassiliicoccales archaeon]|nr:MAG: GTP cyclohydrolase I FolE2 [Methanomassiliicoccales archaeon]